MKLQNPFVTAGYAGADYFCDRQKETAKVVAAMSNDRNVTLIAPRRYGKTGLIQNAFRSLSDEMTCVYIDIFAVKDFPSFVRLFAESVLGALHSRSEKVVAAIGKFFKSCRPTASLQGDGSVTFSFDIRSDNAEASLEEVFAYLKQIDRRVVIAIDEFQQVREFPECRVEALLRGYIQFVPWVGFIFAGSRRHLMTEMFVSPQGPFYQSTQILDLDVIPESVYAAFAKGFFTEAGKAFDADAFAALYARYDGVTWYLQAILNKVWESGRSLEGIGQIEIAEAELIEERALVYHDLLASQNDASQELLRAVAAARVVAEPTSAAFVRQAGMRGASTIRAALKDLSEKDLVYHSPGGWIVYDRLFGRWIAAQVTKTR